MDRAPLCKEDMLDNITVAAKVVDIEAAAVAAAAAANSA